MIEWLAPGFIYSLLKDGAGLVRGRKRRLTPAQILELRQKWRPLFEEEIWKTHQEKLRKDIVIRDVGRLDSYTDVDKKAKGISPWFRAGLMDTYHKGILVGLRWQELSRCPGNGSWHSVRYKSGEKGEVNSILIGKIPYEKIEAVEWRGDEYYYFPHIYCYFDTKTKEPYENVVYCLEHPRSEMPPYYSELVPYEAVRQNDKRLGIDYTS